MHINYGKDFKVRINANLHTYSDSECRNQNQYLLPLGTIIWIIRDEDTQNYLVYTNWAANFQMPMFIKNEAVANYTSLTTRSVDLDKQQELEEEVE